MVAVGVTGAQMWPYVRLWSPTEQTNNRSSCVKTIGEQAYVNMIKIGAEWEGESLNF